MQRIFYSLISLAIFFSFTDASAQKLDKTFNDWSVFTLQNKGEKMCYIASTPTKKAGTYKSRGEPYLIVTHRSKTVDEVSASSGYAYAESSKVNMTIDKKNKFELFTSLEVPDVAWAKDAAADAKVVSAMKGGTTLVIDGKSKSKTTSKDTYSLKGFSTAYKHMKSLCK